MRVSVVHTTSDAEGCSVYVPSLAFTSDSEAEGDATHRLRRFAETESMIVLSQGNGIRGEYNAKHSAITSQQKIAKFPAKRLSR